MGEERENVTLTQRVPWICDPQVGGGLVLAHPSRLTGRLLGRNGENIHQVHEGSLVPQTTENNNQRVDGSLVCGAFLHET